MAGPDLFDPYAGNILCSHLGPILSPAEAIGRLLHRPQMPRPSDLAGIPPHIRMHYLLRVRNLHVPTAVEGQVYQTIDMMVRENYRHLDPALPSTFATVTGEVLLRPPLRMPPTAAAAVGVSGTGKSVSIESSLRLFDQVIQHPSFPNVNGPFQQVVWLSITAPESGRAEDLARCLMEAWERATRTSRFEMHLCRARLNPTAALQAWTTVARSHFLGVLHIDEIQNLFKMVAKALRMKRKPGDGPLELRLVEDQCLRWLLNLLNHGIPVFFSGTPDGIGALSKRFATQQRMLGGEHAFHPFSGSSPAYVENFLGQLARYQVTARPLKMNASAAELIYRLTAGIPRLIVALWVAAQRLALEDQDKLELIHLSQAADTFLAPVAPAVQALLSRDHLRLQRYEDMVTSDPGFWSRFWEAVEPAGGEEVASLVEG